MGWKLTCTTILFLAPASWPPPPVVRWAPAPRGAAISSPRLKEDHELDLGEFKLRVLHTLGYTPEHITFLVIKKGPGKEREPNRQTAIFTGGALMLGGAARVDLLGRQIAPFLAR